MNWSKVHFLSTMLLLLISQSYSQDLFNITNSLRYGVYHYQQGNFSKASIEFERVFTLGGCNVQCKTMLLSSYLHNNKYSSIAELYNMHQPEEWMTSDTLAMLICKGLILNGSYQDATNFSSNNALLLDRQKTFLTNSIMLHDGEWCKFQSVYTPSVFNQYNNTYAAITAYKLKTPAMAGIMSAIVPGSGKAYAGYWKNGLTNLLSISLFSWQAYRGFKQQGADSAYGWIFASVSASFYLGNIYGSVKAVNKRNYLEKEKIYHSFEEEFNQYYPY